MEVALSKVNRIRLSPPDFLIRDGGGASGRNRASSRYSTSSSHDSGLDLGPDDSVIDIGHDSGLEEEEEWAGQRGRQIARGNGKTNACRNNCGGGGGGEGVRKVSLCDIIALLEEQKSFRQELEELHQQNFSLDHILTECATKVETFNRKLLSVEYELTDLTEDANDSDSPKEQKKTSNGNGIVKTFKIKLEPSPIIQQRQQRFEIKEFDNNLTDINGIIDAEIDMLSDLEDHGEELTPDHDYQTPNNVSAITKPSFTFKYQSTATPSPEPSFKFSYKPNGSNVNSPVLKKQTSSEKEVIKISTPVLLRNIPFAFSSRTELATCTDTHRDSVVLDDFGYDKRETFSPDSLAKSNEFEISLLGEDREKRNFSPTVKYNQPHKLNYGIKIADDSSSVTSRKSTPYKIDFIESEDHTDLFGDDDEDNGRKEVEEDGLMGSWVTDVFKQYQSLTITKVTEMGNSTSLLNEELAIPEDKPIVEPRTLPTTFKIPTPSLAASASSMTPPTTPAPFKIKLVSQEETDSTSSIKETTELLERENMEEQDKKLQEDYQEEKKKLLEDYDEDTVEFGKRVQVLTVMNKQLQEEKIAQEKEQVDKLLEDLHISEEDVVRTHSAPQESKRPTTLPLIKIKFDGEETSNKLLNENKGYNKRAAHECPPSPAFDVGITEEERKEKWRERPFRRRAARTFFARLFACWHN